MNINKETLRLYLQHTRRNKKTFVIMLLAIPIGAAMIDSILPYFLSEAVGAIGQGDNSQMARLLTIGAAVGITGAALNFIGFQAMVRHEASILSSLRDETFAALMKKDNQFFINQKIGSMTSKYIDFTRGYIHIQDLFIIRTLGFVLAVGSGLVILAMHSLLLTLMVAVLIAILVIEIRWSAKKRAAWRQTRKKLVSEIHGHVADALTNNLVVRSFAGEDREIKGLNKFSRNFSDVYKKDIGFMATEGSSRVALMTVMQIVTIVIAARMLSTDAITLAIAIFIIAYMQRIGSQLFMLGDIINGYDQALLESQPMTEMLLVENEIQDKASQTLDGKKLDISLENISYKYPDGDTVMADLSLNIPTGQKIGLVGHSGAGKTTLVNLLLRFADVTGGVIKIGGHDIRGVTQKSLREHIAYVPQEPMLFHRSLRENIAYGKPDATDKEIRDAARKAHALEFIEKLPDGLDTLVGERGVKLSGGQRQRVAIARAILKDAPILILDEATSALDSESERLIQDALEKLMKGRTSIVIAHRLSTIAKLDRIVVLDNGKVVEDGAHEKLLKQKGIYAKLWSHQSGGFIEE